MNESKTNKLEPENHERMPVPEIKVKREKGIELFAGFMASQKQPLEDNDEAMEWVALSYDHPEYKDEILSLIKTYKSSLIKNPDEFYEKTINLLKEYEKTAKPFDLSEEIKKRVKMIPQYREQILKSIRYFHPDKKTSDIKNVQIIPGDQILPLIDTGRAIGIGDTRFIISHTENPDNFDHEFLHGIINPITEKFVQYFQNDKQKQKIIEYTNGGIKGYGNHALSILNEELIQTYNEYVKGVIKKKTLPDIREELEKMKEDDFAKLKNGQGSNTSLRKPLEEFKDLNDLKARSEYFYKKFIKDKILVKNELRERLYGFYKEYENDKQSDETLSFEKYFTQNYKKILE